jgi:1-acyl-sn-glycerol-3-phosphate acyltransferase
MPASTQTSDRAYAPPTDGGVTGLVTDRAKSWSVEGPNARFMASQKPLWAFLCDHYFRVDIEGWHRLPPEHSLLVGNHSGGPLTMDTWTFSAEWWRRFEDRRILHGTAHDVLMTLPGLGEYFRLAGVIPASRKGVTAALDAGHDVMVWPGGDLDAMRAWRKRDQVVLGERKGFIRQAIKSGVPIVPVATVGGHDTVFILSEGRRIANALDRLFGLKRILRGENFPIILGFPFGITPEIFPVHIPLPAKIRTELLEPVELDTDPERADDDGYVKRMYREVEQRIQAGVDRLARRRSFPIFG